jgi:hypothetical protein
MTLLAAWLCCCPLIGHALQALDVAAGAVLCLAEG